MIHYVKDCSYNKVTKTKLIKREVAKIAVKVILFNGRSRKELLQKIIILIMVILIRILMLIILKLLPKMNEATIENFTPSNEVNIKCPNLLENLLQRDFLKRLFYNQRLTAWSNF